MGPNREPPVNLAQLPSTSTTTKTTTTSKKERAPQQQQQEHRNKRKASASGECGGGEDDDHCERERSTTRARFSSADGGAAGSSCCWTEAVHRMFVEAVYSVGLQHASPAVILEKMVTTATTTAGTTHTDEEQQPQPAGAGAGAEGLTSERVKSHLQKYRNNRDKSRTEFLGEYDYWMRKATMAAVSATSSSEVGGDRDALLLGGDLPAFLSYSVMREEGAVDGFASSSSGKSGGVTAARGGGHGGGENGATASSSPSFLTRSSIRAESREYARRYSGANVPFPVLTEEERDSPLGEAMGQVIALFSPLTQHLMQERMKRQQQHHPSSSATGVEPEPTSSSSADHHYAAAVAPGMQNVGGGGARKAPPPSSVSRDTDESFHNNNNMHPPPNLRYNNNNSNARLPAGQHAQQTAASFAWVRDQAMQHLGPNCPGVRQLRSSLDEVQGPSAGPAAEGGAAGGGGVGGCTVGRPPAGPEEATIHHPFSGISPFHTDSIIQPQHPNLSPPGDEWGPPPRNHNNTNGPPPPPPSEGV